MLSTGEGIMTELKLKPNYVPVKLKGEIKKGGRGEGGGASPYTATPVYLSSRGQNIS